MERLTKRVDGIAVLESWAIDKDPVSIIQRLCNRLAAYEDTGLEPEEIIGLKNTCEQLSGINDSLFKANQEMGKDLAEWKKAHDDGRLVVLPCKIGAPVYTTHWWKDVKEKCTDRKGNSFYRTVHKNIIKKERFNPFGPDYEWLGKTVFLTREEAEAALAQEGASDGKENT